MKNELVVLLHGILRSDWDMYPMELAFERRGYECLNIKYPSTKHTIEDLAKIVNEELEADPRYKNADQVHFVAHSMGGLITRYIMANNRPENLGRVSMMGTPNQGSEVADFLMVQENGLRRAFKKAFKKVFGPAGHQLGTNMEHIDGNKVDYPVGIVASDFSFNPLAKAMFGKGAANDTLVSVEGTKLEGMKDHIIIPSTHAIMMLDPRVIEQVLKFIEDGEFDHKDDLKPKISQHPGPEPE